jgi:hypothetical protein
MLLIITTPSSIGTGFHPLKSGRPGPLVIEIDYRVRIYVRECFPCRKSFEYAIAERLE